MNLIRPRTLKGFRDYAPALMMPRESMMQTARDVFRSFGFAPIDTPVLEYAEILTGKGGDETDRQMFRFQDNGGRDVAMRFDLTVPLARFAAQHIGTLGTPFKRYHIAPVFRGENPQAGRYREFVQCDFDTVGTRSVVADIEIVGVIDSLLTTLGLDRYTVALNNRAVLNGFLRCQGVFDQATGVLRALDKLSKIGPDGVRDELSKLPDVTGDAAGRILEMASRTGDVAALLDQLRSDVDGDEDAVAGVDRLREVYDGAIASGVAPSRLTIDLSIARGLDYYTGVIFETTLDELPEIGSICSGGRYDDLASLYTKQELPGVGASLGLDRLLAALEQLDRLPGASTPAQVMVAMFDGDHRDDYLRLAGQLRRAGVAVELYPDAKKLGQQLKYAEARGFAQVVIAGSREWAEGRIQVKTLADRSSTDVAYVHDSPDALISAVRSTES